MTGRKNGSHRRPRRLRRPARRGAAVAMMSAALLFLGAACCGENASQLHRTDSQPPSLLGVRDLRVYEGDPITYLEGVTLLDAVDPEPVLTVDSSRVDVTTPGEYTVIYTGTDASGNRVAQEATVTVEAIPEGWIAPQDIDAALENLIADMGLRDLETEEQVRAIYDWARGNLHYGGHTDRENLRQAAYGMLTGRKGDCYGYFALTKALFDALDIPNIDVQKVRNFDEDSDHFWSLVSIDGGEHYYHFDATPRVGQTDSFCLVTDEALDTYSAANKNSHNRDTSLYPATPKEALK